MSWIVVTDLDGTLLDDQYPVAEAARALDELAAIAPDSHVVLATSKTFAETEEIARLATHLPSMILENGGGVAWTGNGDGDAYSVAQLGTPYGQIIKLLRQIRHERQFQFWGFADMTIQEVMIRTGLDRRQAEYARCRMASEPIVWEGPHSALCEFRFAIEEHGLIMQKGGRFLHITSDVSKRKALEYLVRRCPHCALDKPLLLACGDSPNDLGMIESAHAALLFPQRDGSYLREAGDRLLHAPAAGPAAWIDGVKRLIARFGGGEGTGPANTEDDQ